jgi:hypothetical protein
LTERTWSGKFVPPDRLHQVGFVLHFDAGHRAFGKSSIDAVAVVAGLDRIVDALFDRERHHLLQRAEIMLELVKPRLDLLVGLGAKGFHVAAGAGNLHPLVVIGFQVLAQRVKPRDHLVGPDIDAEFFGFFLRLRPVELEVGAHPAAPHPLAL